MKEADVVSTSRLAKAAVVVRLLTTLLLMSIVAVAMLAVAVLTAFRARRIYAEAMPRWLGITSLRVWGIRLVVDGEPSPAQAVYVINHTSTLDAFVIVALGLPRTRIFMKGWTRVFLPMWLIAKLIGVFWTVPQERQAERVRIFQRADRILRQTGDSVLLSPEGTRVTSGEIGHFNKGAFHLATSLRVPLIPIYIGIPRTMNPGVGYSAGSGTVTARFLPPIATDAWLLSDLEQNKASVRDVFVRIHSEQSPPLTAAAV